MRGFLCHLGRRDPLALSPLFCISFGIFFCLPAAWKVPSKEGTGILFLPNYTCTALWNVLYTALHCNMVPRSVVCQPRVEWYSILCAVSSRGNGTIIMLCSFQGMANNTNNNLCDMFSLQHWLQFWRVVNIWRYLTWLRDVRYLYNSHTGIGRNEHGYS